MYASERIFAANRRIICVFHHVERQIMKAKLATSFFVIGALLAGVAAHADQDTDREHPLTFLKDSAITTKVKANLADEKMNTLMHIRVDTNNHGVVVLTGHTKNQEQSDRAVSIARHTEGVTDVWNHIQVRAED
jgi:hyperosmotically inducible protein